MLTANMRKDRVGTVVADFSWITVSQADKDHQNR